MSELTIRQATTRKQIRELQSLRYRVYCESLEWIENDRFAQDKIEFDEYDDFAIHFGAYYGKFLVGTFRLILPNQKIGLPIYKIVHNLKRAISNLEKCMEISRIIIDKGVALRLKIRRSDLLLAMIRTIYRVGKYEYGVDCWFATFDLVVYRLIYRTGFQFEPIGRRLVYLGSNSLPSVLYVDKLDRFLVSKRNDLFKRFNS